MEDLKDGVGDKIRQNRNMKKNQWSIPWLVKCFKRLLWGLRDGPPCAWAKWLVRRLLPRSQEEVVQRGWQAKTSLDTPRTSL